MNNINEKEWICPGAEIGFGLIVFRRSFTIASSGKWRFHYTADERCMIFVDGKRVAEGPERSSPDHWHFAAGTFDAGAGTHVMTVRLWNFSGNDALGQCSIHPGFRIFDAAFEFSGDWEYQNPEHCVLAHSGDAWSVPPAVRTEDGFNWSAVEGRGGVWRKAAVTEDSRPLYPAELPPMLHSEIENVTFDGKTAEFDHYLCAWPEYEFSGVGTVEIRWYESRSRESSNIPADLFHVNGERARWIDYRWHAGTCVSFETTGTLKIEAVRFFRTGYPLTCRVSFEEQEPRRKKLLEKSLRTLQCSINETFMDCPHYEQLQYEGDSRIEALCMTAVSGDTRLMRQAVRAFFAQQTADGALPCRAPSHEPTPPCVPAANCCWLIPSFVLIAVQMFHDYALAEPGDRDFIAEQLPKARRALDFFIPFRNDGTLREVPGWNFVDWVEGWVRGVPIGAERGTGCTLNLLYAAALLDLADLERFCGNEKQADGREREAAETLDKVRTVFYDADRGLFAEDEGHGYFSEHAQVWAALLGLANLKLLDGKTLPKCSIYFDFYFFEACRMHRRDDLAAARLERYLEFAENELDTLPEEFEKWRSFCHGWGSHYLAFRYPRPAIRARLCPVPIQEVQV